MIKYYKILWEFKMEANELVKKVLKIIKENKELSSKDKAKLIKAEIEKGVKK